VRRYLRENTRLGDGEAIGARTQALNELNVLLVAMVMIQRDIAGFELAGLCGILGHCSTASRAISGECADFMSIRRLGRLVDRNELRIRFVEAIPLRPAMTRKKRLYRKRPHAESLRDCRAGTFEQSHYIRSSNFRRSGIF
jgi:hypothetical protein